MSDNSQRSEVELVAHPPEYVGVAGYLLAGFASQPDRLYEEPDTVCAKGEVAESIGYMDISDGVKSFGQHTVLKSENLAPPR